MDTASSSNVMRSYKFGGLPSISTDKMYVGGVVMLTTYYVVSSKYGALSSALAVGLAHYLAHAYFSPAEPMTTPTVTEDRNSFY